MPDAEPEGSAVCYGAGLNYLLENLYKGINELVRVSKRGGTIVFSVNSKWGVFRSLVGKDSFDAIDFFGRPDYWYIDEVANTVNLPPHPDVYQPLRHFFDAEELKTVLQEAGLASDNAGQRRVSAGKRHKEIVDLDREELTDGRL